MSSSVYRSSKKSSSFQNKASSSQDGDIEEIDPKDTQKKLINCVREVSNFSSISLTDRFDKPSFDPKKLLKYLPIKSPKMDILIQNIKELDTQDYTKHQKVFKHFIFSDVKKGYGAKIIASCLIAAGYTLVLKPSGLHNIVLDEAKINQKNLSKFALLTTTALWNRSTTDQSRKEILSVYNERPDNVYGEKIRFIIIDSGFKEGVDLFDVKYCHIFEDQLTKADLTQAIGRGTRFCGQKGLRFGSKGWKLNIFNYKLYVPRNFDIFKLRFKDDKELLLNIVKKIDKDLQFNINFNDSLSNTIKENALDYYLTANINNLKKQENKSLFQRLFGKASVKKNTSYN